MKQLAVILLFMACFVESRASGALADDSLYCFRFVRGKGMFYVPYKATRQPSALVITHSTSSET